jgi:IS5 family transposase
MLIENAPFCVIVVCLGKLDTLTNNDCAQVQRLRQTLSELESVRAKLEHVLQDIKIRFGYAKIRCRGVAKNAACLTFLTANCQCHPG